MTARPKWQHALIGVALLAIIALVFARTMNRDFNHDEHQFLAPGALLSRCGLLPYRDYPLFHLPNLVFIYAGLDWLTGDLVRSAKAFSALCSAAIAASLLLIACGGASKERPRWFSGIFLPATALTAVFLLDPLFLYTSGKTWNHELPAFLMVAAILLQACSRGPMAHIRALTAGVLIGLAVGTRLTFVTLLCPLGIFYLISQEDWRSRIRLLLCWSIGVGVGLLPTLWTFLTAPEAFLFDNFAFPRLRLLDPDNLRIQKTAAFWRKFRYFAKEIMLPSWILFALYLGIGLPAAIKAQRERSSDYATRLILLSIPFAILGCFAPSRYQYQHYFVVNCLAALGVACALRASPAVLSRWAVSGAAILTVAIPLAASAFRSGEKRPTGIFEYAAISKLFAPSEWFSERVRRIGAEVETATAGQGPILTLAPAWLLPTRLDIYPEFATGPFAWRSAAFIPKETRTRLKFVAPADLREFLAARPPGAVLTGVEDSSLETPLITAIQEAGYQPHRLSKGRTVWTPPPTGGAR